MTINIMKNRQVTNARLILNPWKEEQKFKFGGAEITLPAKTAYEEINITWARKICSIYRELGIVDFTYDEAAQKIYKTQKEFEVAKTLEGLKNMLAAAKMAAQREKQAVKESSLKHGSQVDSLFFDVKKFEKRVAEIEEHIAKVILDNTPKHEGEPVRRGRPPKNESSANTNEG